MFQTCFSIAGDFLAIIYNMDMLAKAKVRVL
jgi:hypothetical protein